MWERRQASVPVWSAVPLRKVHSIIAKFFLCITLSPPSTWTNVLNLQVHPSISVDSALILKGLQYKPSAWQPLSQACISNIWHLGSVTSDYQSVLKVKNACRGTKNNISSLTRVCVCVRAHALNHSVMSDSLWPHKLSPTSLLCPWDFASKNTGEGCHLLLQGIFPIQGSNWHLWHLLRWLADSLPLSHLGITLVYSQDTVPEFFITYSHSKVLPDV